MHNMRARRTDTTGVHVQHQQDTPQDVDLRSASWGLIASWMHDDHASIRHNLDRGVASQAIDLAEVCAHLIHMWAQQMDISPSRALEALAMRHAVAEYGLPGRVTPPRGN